MRDPSRIILSPQPSVCSLLLPVRLKPVLMVVLMPAVSTITALGLHKPKLMPSQNAPLVLEELTLSAGYIMPNMATMFMSMVSMDIMAMDTVLALDIWDMFTMDTTARGPLILSPLLMLTMDTELMVMGHRYGYGMACRVMVGQGAGGNSRRRADRTRV